MRHRVYGKHLGRDKNQRNALFKSLVQSLLLNESIQTSDSKAKAIRGIVDKLINQAKSPITRRLISQFLVNKSISEKLVKEIVPAVSSRTSGYTSIIKLNKRLGDGSLQVQMSLILDKKIEKTVATKEDKPKKVTASSSTKTASSKKESKGV